MKARNTIFATVVVSLLTMLVCSVGSCCESYEECLDYVEGIGTKYAGSSDGYQNAMMRAILFKLAKIEEKLDKPNGGCWVLDTSKSNPSAPSSPQLQSPEVGTKPTSQ